MFGFEFVRPLALAGLVVPALLLLLSLRPERPEPRAIGTFKLWRSLPESREGAGQRRRIPLARWLLVTSLVLGCFGLAEPRETLPPVGKSWTVVVDRSPSMYLPHESGGSRLEVALERLDLKGEVTWVDRGERVTGSFPEAWHVQPPAPVPEPVWSRFDESGVLWITDAVQPGEHAGLVASGGIAVPGPVGESDGRRLVWNGEELIVEGAAPATRVLIDEGLPALVRGVCSAWAAEHGLDGSAGPVRLEVRASGGDSPQRGGRDGWTVAGSGAVVHGAEPWLTNEHGRAIISHAPGRIDVGLTTITQLAPEEAAWVISWCELLEAALLPAPGVVSLDERAAVAMADRAGRAREAPTPAPDPWPPAAILAAVAAGFGFLALVVGRGQV